MTRFLSVLVFALAIAAPAAAQGGLAQARAHLDEARFADAIASLDEIETSPSGLDEQGARQFFEIYALAAAAQRDDAAVARALRSLLAIHPEAQLGEAAPPSLRHSLEELRAVGVVPVGLEVTAHGVEGGAEIEIRPVDTLGLVQRVQVRQQTETGWRTIEGTPVRLQGPGRLVYYVEALGPGGAPIAHFGSATEPASVLAGNLLEVVALDETPAPGNDDSWLHILGVAGGIVLVAAIVTAVLVSVLPGDLTRPGRPMELR